MSTLPQEHRAAPRASLDALLAFAWDTDVFVSADAMAATGLTRSTAIDALDELIKIGLLRELPNARAVGEYSKGRPSRRFELRADAATVIGMDAGRSHLTTTVADLRGRTLSRTTVELDISNESAAERRAAVLGAVDDTLVAAKCSRESVLAICVGVPAPVDSRGASPQRSDGFWRRMNPHLLDLLEEWIPIVRIENDALLAAVAEGAVGSAIDCRDYVVLLAGDRFGAGVVIDGHLLRGAHGGVGEMVAFNHVEGVETAAGVGIRLTEWVRTAAAAGEIPAGHPLLELPLDQLTGRAVLGLARSGDVWSRSIVGRAGDLLARIAEVFVSLYDPVRIIVAGAVAEGLDDVMQVARVNLRSELDSSAPEFVLSTLGAGSVATGAVSAAVEAARMGVLRRGAGSLRKLREAV